MWNLILISVQVSCIELNLIVKAIGSIVSRIECSCYWNLVSILESSSLGE